MIRNLSQIPVTVVNPKTFISALSYINCPQNKFWEMLSCTNAEIALSPSKKIPITIRDY